MQQPRQRAVQQQRPVQRTLPRAAQQQRALPKSEPRAAQRQQPGLTPQTGARQAQQPNRPNAGPLGGAQQPTLAQPGGRTPAGQTAERRDGRPDRNPDNIRAARERLSPDQRQRLTTAFDVRRARVDRARFDWHVGHRIPRSVRLFAVPLAVVSFFPYYRDYRYFTVGDDICIVDPSTYEVVDVIDEGFRGRAPQQQFARLSLTAEQVAFIRDSIPGNAPEADIRLRLALGAEIPPTVQLELFPQLVLDRIPMLQDYRFVLADNQIVLVDPRDRSIAYVIDRS